MIVKFDVIYPSDERKLLPSQMMDVIKGWHLIAEKYKALRFQKFLSTPLSKLLKQLERDSHYTNAAHLSQ